MNCLRVLMGEGLQVKVLGILRGTLHGKAFIAVAFSVILLKASRDAQAPG